MEALREVWQVAPLPAGRARSREQGSCKPAANANRAVRAPEIHSRSCGSSGRISRKGGAMSTGRALLAILACALITGEAGAQTMPRATFHSVGRGAPMLETLPSRSDLPRRQPDLSNYLLERT